MFEQNDNAAKISISSWRYLLVSDNKSWHFEIYCVTNNYWMSYISNDNGYCCKSLNEAEYNWHWLLYCV